MYNFLELQKASTGELTFVSKNRKELHKNVRKFLADSVKAYAESGSHTLDAKTGLRVALEFNKQYAPYVRSALSRVNGSVVWAYDKAGVTSYRKLETAKKAESLISVINELEKELDKLDADNVKEPPTEQQKLERSAKSFTTSLIKADSDKVNAAMKTFDNLSADELQNLYCNLETMTAKISCMLTLQAVGG